MCVVALLLDNKYTKPVMLQRVTIRYDNKRYVVSVRHTDNYDLSCRVNPYVVMLKISDDKSSEVPQNTQPQL